MPEKDLTMRLDMWMKIARIVKTRSAAVKLCDGGKVKVAGRTAKPAKMIAVGDEISVFHHKRRRQITVLGIAKRSISAKLAAELYEEAPPTSEEVAQQEQEHLARLAARQYQPKFPGRPTKRDRRDIDKFRGRS